MSFQNGQLNTYDLMTNLKYQEDAFSKKAIITGCFCFVSIAGILLKINWSYQNDLYLYGHVRLVF